jgi:hypothetical protein
MAAACFRVSTRILKPWRAGMLQSVRFRNSGSAVRAEGPLVHLGEQGEAVTATGIGKRFVSDVGDPLKHGGFASAGGAGEDEQDGDFHDA